MNSSFFEDPEWQTQPLLLPSSTAQHGFHQLDLQEHQRERAVDQSADVRQANHHGVEFYRRDGAIDQPTR